MIQRSAASVLGFSSPIEQQSRKKKIKIFCWSNQHVHPPQKLSKDVPRSRQKYLISWSCGQDKLTVGIEGEAVHFSCVSIHRMTGFGGVVWPGVPAGRGKHGIKIKLYIPFHWGITEMRKPEGQKQFVKGFPHLHHELLIISNRSKQGLMEQVPGYIFHHCCVSREDGLGIHHFAFFGNSADIPQANGL